MGYPIDLVVCSALGVDMFDCVWPSTCDCWKHANIHTLVVMDVFAVTFCDGGGGEELTSRDCFHQIDRLFSLSCCSLIARTARFGSAIITDAPGLMHLRRACYAQDFRPIDPDW